MTEITIVYDFAITPFLIDFFFKIHNFQLFSPFQWQYRGKKYLLYRSEISRSCIGPSVFGMGLPHFIIPPLPRCLINHLQIHIHALNNYWNWLNKLNEFSWAIAYYLHHHPLYYGSSAVLEFVSFFWMLNVKETIIFKLKFFEICPSSLSIPQARPSKLLGISCHKNEGI